MSELTDLIDRMVNEKTFSLDGLDSVKALKDKAVAQDAQISLLESKLRKVEAESAARKESLAVANAQLAEWEKRLMDLVAREKAITALEQKVAVAEARFATMHETVGMFLKLPSVRRNVTETVGHVLPNPTPGNYPLTYSTQDRVETVETQE